MSGGAYNYLLGQMKLRRYFVCSWRGHRAIQLYSSHYPFVVCGRCQKYLREGVV